MKDIGVMSRRSSRILPENELPANALMKPTNCRSRIACRAT